MSFMAWVTFSRVSASIWVLDEAQVVVSGVVSAAFITVVGGDMVVIGEASECKRISWGATAQPGNECHRL